MSQKSLFMGTTDVPAENSAGAIVKLLVAAGARSVHMRYGEDRKLTGIDFTFMSGTLEFPFSIPVRIALLFNKLWAARKTKNAAERQKVEAQAERVAWRQLYRWVEAQIALVETGMVDTVEVFTPYCVDRSGQTVFQIMMASRVKELSAGGSK